MEKLKIGFDLDGPIFFLLFVLVKDAKRILNLLVEQGHEIKIVTARGEFLLSLAKKTLEFYEKFFGLVHLEIAGVGPNGYKYKELEGFDIFFDNKVEHLIAIDGKVRHLFLFGKSENGFIGLPNWQLVYSKIMWLANEPIKELAV